MKKTPLVEWKQMTIRVPVEVHRALKVRAAEEGRSLAVIIEGLVRQYLVSARGATAALHGLKDAFPGGKLVALPGGTVAAMGDMIAEGQSVKRVMGRIAGKGAKA